MTDPLGGGVILPYGDDRRMNLRAERVGEGQFLVTLEREPLAVIVFTTARDDSGAPPVEIADRLAAAYGVPVYSAIERLVLADFARGVHALLEKAERDCAARPAVAPIRVYADLVETVETIGRLESASAVLRAPGRTAIPVTGLLEEIDRLTAALIAATGAFARDHRQEDPATGFPTVEFPYVLPEDT